MPDFVEYIKGYLDNDKKQSGWDDYDFSLDNMKKIHLELFRGYEKFFKRRS